LKRFKAYGRYYSGIFKLTKMPDYLILTSNKDNFSRVLLNEAINYTTIDLIVLNDSLVDSRGCNFIIPGNEKSMSSLDFLYNLFYIEIQKGRFLYLCERYKQLILKKKENLFLQDEKE
jgi:ribosomal protein S2